MIQRVIKIGLTYTGTDEKHQNYLRWLKGNEDIQIVRLSPADNNVEEVKNLDGIVLSGGVDVHPKYYHSDIIDYPNAPEMFNEERDAFEKQVFEISQQKNIPLLAVCRGMQLVNCLLGGTLLQDIGPVANTIHRFEHNDKAHGINIVPGTLLHEITGVERSVTNSAHHQAINTAGKGLVINCTSDDGIIEGIEWTEKINKSFFFGCSMAPGKNV
jgi:putative glutamine amidotransferase